jgi:dephospho-CoA kinase
MIKVGVTGGIGSGKSTVCEMFARLGVPVYDSDTRAREILDGGGRVRSAVVALLGEGAYRGDVLDRGFVAARVFGDRMLLAGLNAIVHPAVALDFEAWTLPFREREPYVVLESAILFESGFERFVDRVVTVSAPRELRLERVCSGGRGRGMSREDVMRRMDNQLEDGDRERRAWRVIDNGGSPEQLAVQVEEIDRMLRSGGGKVDRADGKVEGTGGTGEVEGIE